jgi:hypothetical protein
MAVINFYAVKGDKLVGTVTTSREALAGDTNSVRELTDSWEKSPSEFVAKYAHWSNGYLYSRVGD